MLSLRFNVTLPDPNVEPTGKSDLPSGLIPNHKQSMALFLERVYGIEDRELFFLLLEEAFLPDLRAATMLERVSSQNCFLCFVPLMFKFHQRSKWSARRYGICIRFRVYYMHKFRKSISCL